MRLVLRLKRHSGGSLVLPPEAKGMLLPNNILRMAGTHHRSQTRWRCRSQRWKRRATAGHP
eukprot:scaffold1687_cov405-Prasinococcus_capsulatus_cf.AAC.28